MLKPLRRAPLIMSVLTSKRGSITGFIFTFNLSAEDLQEGMRFTRMNKKYVSAN